MLPFATSLPNVRMLPSAPTASSMSAEVSGQRASSSMASLSSSTMRPKASRRSIAVELRWRGGFVEAGRDRAMAPAHAPGA